MELVRIDRATLPPGEHTAADTVERNLLHLETAAEEFRRTVELYVFTHDRKLAGQDDSRRMVSWINIAGRNGAIVAYGMHMVMQAINSINAPILRQKVDMGERSQATKLFAAEFPNIAHIRTSAAHPGELSATDKELEKHRLKEPMLSGLGFFGPGSFVHGGMHAENDKLTYTASFEGRPASYELSMRKADVLAMVAQHYNRAFYPLENPMAAAQRIQMRRFEGLGPQSWANQWPVS